MEVVEEPSLPGVLTLRPPIQWDTIVEGYLAEVGADRSPNTVSAYRQDLVSWTSWCARAAVDPLGAGRADVVAYVASATKAGLAKATIARRLTPLRAVYDWAVGEELVARSPAGRVRGPKIPTSSPTLGLDVDQAVDLLEVATAAGAVEAALVHLLVANGLRVSEVCGADVVDLIAVLGRPAIRVTRKGGAEAVEALAPSTVTALDAHLAGRRRGPLFFAPRGGRMYRQAVRRLVIRLADAAGIPQVITTHSLRHTFVTQGLAAGVTLEALQDAAGHADPATTRRYDRARHALEHHPTYVLSDFLAAARSRRRHPHGIITATGETWAQLPLLADPEPLAR